MLAAFPRIVRFHRAGMNVVTWPVSALWLHRVLSLPKAVELSYPGRGSYIPLRWCLYLLTADNRCSIHPVSPYGCAFFDSHMSKEQVDRRSIAGRSEIALEW
jgi:hypothetical protein